MTSAMPKTFKLQATVSSTQSYGMTKYLVEVELSGFLGKGSNYILSQAFEHAYNAAVEQMLSEITGT